MKTILAATDFSAAAHNAAVYAASLAKVFSARLVIYNAWQQILSPAMEAPDITPLPELREISEGQLSNEAAALESIVPSFLTTRIPTVANLNSAWKPASLCDDAISNWTIE